MSDEIVEPLQNQKNMSAITSELNTDSDFGVGVMTGTQELEGDWSLCIALCCSSSCCGGGGGSTQMKKAK